MGSNIHKGEKDLIFVTRDEADYLREHLQHVNITTTSKHKRKNQKKRYAEETKAVNRCLAKYRAQAHPLHSA